MNFLYGIPQYAVSIAAELDGEVVAGIVLNVATGAEYTATLGGPAHRDGVPIRVRATVPLAERLIGTGFSYEARQREMQAAALLHLIPKIRDIRRFGSCALDLCAVAQGSLDGYMEEGVNLWDHAAGGLVARCRRRPGRDRPRGRRAADRDRGPGGRIRRVQDCDRRGWVPRGSRFLTGSGAGNRRPSSDVHPAHRSPVCPFPGRWCTILPCRRLDHVGLGDDRREERPKGVKRHGD